MDIEADPYTAYHKAHARTIWADPNKKAPVAVNTSMIAIDMVYIAGTALCQYKGTGPSWRRDRLIIDTRTHWQRRFSAFSPPIPPQVAPTATLASISNSGNAVEAGWAVDEAEILWTRVDQYVDRLKLAVKIAVRDGDGYVLRVGFDVKVVGLLTNLWA